METNQIAIGMKYLFGGFAIKKWTGMDLVF